MVLGAAVREADRGCLYRFVNKDRLTAGFVRH